MTDEQAEREASRTQAPAADAVLEADGADARAGTFRAPSTVTLDPSDYVGWAATMQAMLEYGGLWEHVAPRGERLPASTAPLAASSSSVTATVAPGRHTQKAREAYLMLVTALRDADSRRVLVGLPPQDPRALWQALQRRYQHMPKAAAAALYSQLLSLRQSSSESARAFADRIALMRHQLTSNGRPVSDDDAITVFVNGVHSTLAQQVSSYYNIAANATFDDIVQVARGEETRLLLAGHARGAGGAGGGGGSSGGGSGSSSALGASHSASGGVQLCHICQQPGHNARICPKAANRRQELTATPQQVAAGACPRPGHRTHKASECRAGGAMGAVPASAAAASSGDNTMDGYSSTRMHVSLGMAAVSGRASAGGGAAAVTALSARASSGPVVLDSGASHTVVPASATLLHAQPAPDVSITVANGDVLTSPLCGTAVLAAAGNLDLHVRHALQHAEIDRTLLSVYSVLRDEAEVEQVVFRRTAAAALTPSGKVLFTASVHGEDGIYTLDTDAEHSRKVAQAFVGAADSAPAPAPQPAQGAPAAAPPGSASGDAELWHQRLCHCSYDGMRALVRAKAVGGLEGVVLPAAGAESALRCAGCAAGKAHRRPFGDSLREGRQARHVLAVVDADVAGPLSVESLGGARYFLLLLDEWSGYASIFFLAHKSEAAGHIETWFRQARTRHGRHVVEFHTDGGGEFLNARVAALCRRTGTVHTHTAPHTPQHNGKVERLVRTVSEWTSAALAHCGAPKTFWALAADSAVYVRNLSALRVAASAASEDRAATPHALWHGEPGAVPLGDLRVFGCDADVLYTVSPGLKLAKLTAKSRLCMFVGYDRAARAWRFWDPTRGDCVTSRDATFHERRFTVAAAAREAERAAADGAESEDDDNWLTRTALDGETRLAIKISREEADNAARAGPAAAQPATSSADSGSEAADSADERAEAAGQASDSDNDAPPPAAGGAAGARAPALAGPRRSARERVQTHRYGMLNGNLAQGRSVYVCLAERWAGVPPLGSAPPSGAGDVQVPRSYAEAMSLPGWPEAIAKELASHTRNGTWQFVPLPAGRTAIGCRYVFRVKLQADGSVERLKARLTAQGFRQRDGIDYFDTYAPVLCYTTLRVLLALVAAEDYELHQMDVETAFLNADVQEDLYMRVPDGVQAPEGTVCKLRKALYGIKQAPHAWHAEIASTLTATLGYAPSPHDPCLFTRRSRTGRVLLFPLFVDDCFPACHPADLAEMQADKARLCAIYKIKDGGDARLVLGMRVTRDRARRTLHLDQQVYLEKLLADYGATHCKPARTPMEAGSALDTPVDEPADPAAAPPAWRAAYRALVGSLGYAALATRPDIAFAVGWLARALVSPTDAHRVAGERVLRYLCGTRTLGVTFHGGRLLCWSDADWAGGGSRGAGQSTSGWVCQLGSGPVSWASKKQSMVALSSTESEYVAAAAAAQEVTWLRALLLDCGVPAGPPTTLQCDNQAAKALSETARVSRRSKHINVRFHFLREKVADGTLRVQWVPSAQQLADILTKPLGPEPFLRLRDALMGTTTCTPNGR